MLKGIVHGFYKVLCRLLETWGITIKHFTTSYFHFKLVLGWNETTHAGLDCFIYNVILLYINGVLYDVD
jgi:hypothetical protein